jgi:hypothetical protein
LVEHRTVAPDVAGSIPVSHPKVSIAYRNHLPLSPRKCQTHHFFMGFPHVRCSRVAIDIHRGPDVRVPHEFLLHPDRSTDRIQPGAMSLAERVRTDVTDACLLRRVLIVDYENSDLIDRLTEIGGYLHVPLPMDASWLRVMQSPTQEEIAAAIEYFDPQLVVVDGLRGIDPQIEKTEVASRVLGECQKISLRKGLSWLFIHNIRKGSEKANEEFKLDLFDTDTRVMEWMEKVAGSRGLINQTSVRIGIDQVKRARGEAVLGLRGFYKGKGEFGPIKIARQFDESGEPVGYYLVCGASLLSQDDIT